MDCVQAVARWLLVSLCGSWQGEAGSLRLYNRAKPGAGCAVQCVASQWTLNANVAAAVLTGTVRRPTTSSKRAIVPPTWDEVIRFAHCLVCWLPPPQQMPQPLCICGWCVHAPTAVDCTCRFHPEVLDSLCFPSGLSLSQPEGASAAAAAPGGKGAGSKAADPNKPAFSALDGLWQLLKQASSLMASEPKLLAVVLRVLSTLWECQGSAHGAVELLRSQPGFWTALKVG